jgi:hypothetical protein
MLNTIAERQAAQLAELRGECPRVQVEAWYDATGGPGTGKWQFRGTKNGETIIKITKGGFLPARDAFRAAYTKAVELGLLL